MLCMAGWLVESFSGFIAEEDRKEDAEFVATFNIPAVEIVGGDEFEVRRRIVDNRLHDWAVTLDKDEKLLDAAKKALFDGVGSNDQQDEQTVKLRRAAIDQLDAKLAKESDELEHKILIAQHCGYDDIDNTSDALAYNPVRPSEGFFDWAQFFIAALVAIILGALGS